jgi:hypothetical protein
MASLLTIRCMLCHVCLHDNNAVSSTAQRGTGLRVVVLSVVATMTL